MALLRTTVERLRKTTRQAGSPMRYITRLHADAMELCGRTIYGPPSFLLAFMISGLVFMFFGLESIALSEIVKDIRQGRTIGYIGLATYALITFALLGIPVLSTLFLPAEAPIVFDRKHQKVHWSNTRGNWKRRFLLRPAMVRSYHWSEVEAEHQTNPTSRGNNVGLSHSLVFIVRNADGSVRDEYLIPHITQPVSQLWAYISGYMQGQEHPTVADVLPGDGVVVGYWDIIVNLAPYLRPGTFVQSFKQMPKFTLCLCLFAPVAWAWLVVYLFTKLLADLTEQQLLWPQSVLDALGPDISTYSPEQGIPAPKQRYRRKVLKGV